MGVVVAGKGWEGWKGGRGGGGFGVGDGDEELGWRGWGWKVLWVERGGEGEAVGGFISGGDGGGRRGV